jgi:multiple sugar transport system substrate-binding protein
MKKVMVFTVVLCLLSVLVINGFAGGQSEGGAGKVKAAKAVFYMALYDGLRQDYLDDLESSFIEENPDIELDIVPVQWDRIRDKITTSIAVGNPPEASVIDTNWILEFMPLDAIDDVSLYVSKSTIDNIFESTKVGQMGDKLMGLPIAAGARILAVNKSITSKVPRTMEEMRAEALRVNDPPQVYGYVMPGKKFVELTDFAYYVYAAGGDFFEKKADGSFGKSTVNSPECVKALTFMNNLGNVDKVTQPGWKAMDRMETHPIFYAGKSAYVFIGAWVESAMKEAGADFDVAYGPIPGFEGNTPTSLVVVDNIAIFKEAENKKEIGKFLDYFYTDEWKAKFDEMVGFPPITISASKLPQFKNPLYDALAEAAEYGAGWPPLMEGWSETRDIIWDEISEVFLGNMTPQEALDEAARKIDEMRGM